MKLPLNRSDETQPINQKTALMIAAFFTVLILLRDALILWAFSFGYYRDSNLYVNLGRTLFQKSGPFSTGVVSFPFPFLNAITFSSGSPLRLIGLQILIGAIAAGGLIYVISRKNPLLACAIGVMFVFDFVWGAINRNVMTEGLYVSFIVLSLALLLSHYDRRSTVSSWELLAAGIFYGWAFIFRPSNLFLTLIIVPLYFWLTRSWRKTALLTSGFLIIYLALGLFNLWSSGEFRLMGQSGYYTGSPLFVYRLFSPDNGPVSQEIDRELSACYPEEDYANAMDTTAGGTKNNEILYGEFIPCLKNSGHTLDQISDMFTQAYIEGILRRPTYFAGVLAREGITFIKYNSPTILRFYLKPELNNRCQEYDWCEDIRDGRFSWGNKLPFVSIYEKAGTKVFQLYLVPVGLLSTILWDNQYLAVALSGIAMVVFLLLATRGRVRFLVIATLLLLGYIVLSVISGYGFLARYASVVTPFYIVLSATTLVALGKLLWNLVERFKRTGNREA
ncbi:MAG: hypothetical protein U9R58_02680 [Chloroflexota bacterium]|nr:hypothetical protein [Chloroflexota bacterium]